MACQCDEAATMEVQNASTKTNSATWSTAWPSGDD